MNERRLALGLLAIALIGAGLLAEHDAMAESAGRLGPPWLSWLGLCGGMALLLVGATAPAGAAGFRSLRLGRATRRAGALMLAAGGLGWAGLILAFPKGMFLLVLLKASPVLIALGAVLLRASAAALRSGAPPSLRVLTLGRVAQRMGLVLLLLCFAASPILAAMGRGMGFMLLLFAPDLAFAGLLLWPIGTALRAAEPRAVQAPAVGIA